MYEIVSEIFLGYEIFFRNLGRYEKISAKFGEGWVRKFFWHLKKILTPPLTPYIPIKNGHPLMWYTMAYKRLSLLHCKQLSERHFFSLHKKRVEVKM